MPPFFPYTDLLWDCSAFLKRAEAIKQYYRFDQQWTVSDRVDRSVPDRIVEHGVCIAEIRLKAIIVDQTGEGEYIWMNV